MKNFEERGKALREADAVLPALPTELETIVRHVEEVRSLVLTAQRTFDTAALAFPTPESIRARNVAQDLLNRAIVEETLSFNELLIGVRRVLAPQKANRRRRQGG